MTNTGAVTVSGGAGLVAKNGTAITDSGIGDTITVNGTGSLTLDDTSSISGGKVTVAAWTGTLTLNGTSSISGGTLNNSGTVTTTGTDTIGTETITSSDAINVTGGTLTLDRRPVTQLRRGDGIGRGGAGCQERHGDHQQWHWRHHYGQRQRAR